MTNSSLPPPTPWNEETAALGRRFASVTIRDSIRSWVGDVVAKPLQGDPIGNVVPSALLKYDLPDLAALLADRLTIQ